MRRRAVAAVVAAVIAVAAAVVVVHDAYQAATFNSTDLLCERPDGTLWRDPSQGCTGGEDPRCTEGTGCADSVIVSEGWRRACTWILFGDEAPPRGEPPFHNGPSPGGGCPGRM